MAVTVAYTLKEARDMLSLYKEAEKELVFGQAQSYKIGTREFTAFNLDEIRKQIERFSDIVDALSGNVRTKNVARVVPRDL